MCVFSATIATTAAALGAFNSRALQQAKLYRDMDKELDARNIGDDLARGKKKS
jgi:hypothetical protein